LCKSKDNWKIKKHNFPNQIQKKWYVNNNNNINLEENDSNNTATISSEIKTLNVINVENNLNIIAPFYVITIVPLLFPNERAFSPSEILIDIIESFSNHKNFIIVTNRWYNAQVLSEKILSSRSIELPFNVILLFLFGVKYDYCLLYNHHHIQNEKYLLNIHYHYPYLFRPYVSISFPQ